MFGPKRKPSDFYAEVESHLELERETLQRAQALLDMVARRLSRQYSNTDKDLAVKVYPELRARPIPQAGSLVVVLSGLFLGLTTIVLPLAAVSQRTQEIGIRMAFGADSQDILRMTLGEGFIIVGAGLTIGLASALSAARIVRNFVSVSATDPLTYLSVSATLAVVSLLACYIPARRATKVDPMVALRYE